MRIPFLDLRAANAGLEPVLAAVVERSEYIGGELVERFEREWAQVCGTRYAIGVANGLDALEIALEAVGIGPGDEVIVPSHTYIATWLAVTRAGAKPVPVEPRGFLIDPEHIEAAVTSRTKAIVPTNLYGECCDAARIMQIARDCRVFVIEDAAQSHGQPMYGHIACYSFYPTKNLGALGDAGAIVTNAEIVAEQARLLRDYGSPRKDVYVLKGHNSRLDALQAALLTAKLPRLTHANALRRTQARAYKEGLRGVQIPDTDLGASVWHQFVVRHSRRNALRMHLLDRAIGTRIHYPTPCHKQRLYAGQYPRQPRAEILADSILSLPLGYEFDQGAVIEAVNEFSA